MEALPQESVMSLLILYEAQHVCILWGANSCVSLERAHLSFLSWCWLDSLKDWMLRFNGFRVCHVQLYWKSNHWLAVECDSIAITWEVTSNFYLLAVTLLIRNVITLNELNLWLTSLTYLSYWNFKKKGNYSIAQSRGCSDCKCTSI